MATAVRFSAQAHMHGIFREGTARLGFSASPCTRTYKPENTVKMKRRVNFLRTAERKKLHGIFPVKSLKNDSTSDSLSPSDTIRQFYKYINERNLRKLGDYVSRDCVFEDYTFPNPFEGKKEVMSFYKDLTEGMGPDMKFTIKRICEGDDLTVGVSWNMEWRGKMVPFTRGCSFFECKTEGQRLTIKRAQIAIESPIKLGVMALTLLKAVTNFFDNFPKTAEWFLKSHNFIVTWFLRIFSVTMGPTNQLLAGYVRMWELTARPIGFALKFLLYVAKLILK